MVEKLNVVSFNFVKIKKITEYYTYNIELYFDEI